MSDLSSVGFSDPDLEALRIRLRKMNDQELQGFGLAAVRRERISGGRRVRRLLFNLRKRGQSKSAET